MEEEEEVGANGQAAHRRTGQGQHEVQAAEGPLSYLATLHNPVSVARLTENVPAKRVLLRHAWTALSPGFSHISSAVSILFFLLPILTSALKSNQGPRKALDKAFMSYFHTYRTEMIDGTSAMEPDNGTVFVALLYSPREKCVAGALFSLPA